MASCMCSPFFIAPFLSVHHTISLQSVASARDHSSTYFNSFGQRPAAICDSFRPSPQDVFAYLVAMTNHPRSLEMSAKLLAIDVVIDSARMRTLPRTPASALNRCLIYFECGCQCFLDRCPIIVVVLSVDKGNCS